MAEKQTSTHSETEIETPKVLRRSQVKAEKILREHEKIERLLRDARTKARTHRERIRKVWSELQILIRLVQAYKSGEYRRLPWKALVMIVAAIVYFVNPFDLIPDFITGLGFLDDATVIGLVMKALNDEINRFKTYLSEKEGSVSES